MWKLIIIISSLHFLKWSHGQVIIQGGCDNFKLSTKSNFNISLYNGIWYEIYNYAETSENRSYVMYNFTKDRAIINNNKAEQIYDIKGSAPKMELVLQKDNRTTPIPHWIINTDYESYSLVYGCKNSTNSTIFSWILSRSKHIDPADIGTINENFNNGTLQWSNYYITNQETICNDSTANKALSIMLLMAFALNRFI